MKIERRIMSQDIALAIDRLKLAQLRPSKATDMFGRNIEQSLLAEEINDLCKKEYGDDFIERHVDFVELKVIDTIKS